MMIDMGEATVTERREEAKVEAGRGVTIAP